MKALILTILIFPLFLCCNESDHLNNIQEIESTIKLKLPENIKIANSEIDWAIGDYTSSTYFTVLDKASIKEFTERIRNSPEYIETLPGSIPHGIEYFYWTKDKHNYLYGNTGYDARYISFVLDTITGNAHFSIHED